VDAAVVEEQNTSIEGLFDVIHVHLGRFDLTRLEAVTGRALRSLRPQGRVIVALDVESGPPVGDRDGQGAAGGEPPAFPGLRWEGLCALNGRACAVLRPGGPQHPGAGTPVGVGLATAHAAVRLVTGGPPGTDTRALLDGARASVVEQLEARRLSEQTLLYRIDELTRQLEDERRRPPGAVLVDLARRTWAGRALIRLTRPARRAARSAARRVAGAIRATRSRP